MKQMINLDSRFMRNEYWACSLQNFEIPPIIATEYVIDLQDGTPDQWTDRVFFLPPFFLPLSGVVFYSPLEGFSLLACEVS